MAIFLVITCTSCPNPETERQEEKGRGLPVWSGGRNPGPGCLIFHTCANCGSYCGIEWITLCPSASSFPPCIPYFLFCAIFFPKFSPSILNPRRSRRDLIWVVAEGSGTEKYLGGGISWDGICKTVPFYEWEYCVCGWVCDCVCLYMLCKAHVQGCIQKTWVHIAR